MRTRYSKPSSDIAPEFAVRMQDDAENITKYKDIIHTLISSPPRRNCILCQSLLEGETFENRDVEYVQCNICGHVQSRPCPPPNYPYSISGNNLFAKLYPDLDATAYINRRDRIYTPKLDWLLECLEHEGISRRNALNLRWTELGCGAGYFLSALEHAGAQNIQGIDADEKLVLQAKRFIPNARITSQRLPLHQTVKQVHTDIYVAWFVLEHIEAPHLFFNALQKLPKGTILAFSVPVFSIATLLDICFSNLQARHLDNVVHTQIYTDESIKFALNISNMSLKSQWIFGQDAEDFARYITLSIKNKMSFKLYEEKKSALTSMQDKLQELIDINEFSEQRHILAIKN